MAGNKYQEKNEYIKSSHLETFSFQFKQFATDYVNFPVLIISTMKKTILVLLLSVIASITINAQNSIQSILDRGTLLVGLSGSQPPFSMQKANGELIGFEIELATQLAEELEVGIEFVQLPFDNLMDALLNNKVDIVMSGMTMTPLRNSKVAFVGPYIVSGKSILSKSTIFTNRGNLVEINRKKVKIATMAGTTSEEYVRTQFPAAKVITVPNYDDAVDLILKGNADLMISDYAECVFASFKYQDKDLKVMQDLLVTEPIGMAVNPDLLMINMLENFLKTMEETGDLEELETKWFRSGSWFAELE